MQNNINHLYSLNRKNYLLGFLNKKKGGIIPQRRYFENSAFLSLSEPHQPGELIRHRWALFFPTHHGTSRVRTADPSSRRLTACTGQQTLAMYNTNLAFFAPSLRGWDCCDLQRVT